MFSRSIIVLVSGVLCLQPSAFAEDLSVENLSTLVRKGREAFHRGNYVEAERYHRFAVDEAERTGDNAQKAEALGDLGGVLLASGRHTEAKAVCLRALGLLRNATSKRYMPVLLNNLGTLSNETAEFGEAESYFMQALEAARDLNPSDPYIARVLNNLGTLHYVTGKNGRAKKDFKQAIDVLERAQGQNSPALAPLLNNLGAVHLAEKKWEDAGRLFDRAISLLKHSPGPDVAGVLDSIGKLHFARRRYIEAEAVFRDGYQIRLRAFGNEHPAVASSAANLASTLVVLGQFAEAERLLNDALKTYSNTFGKSSLQVAATLEKLTELFRKTDREEEAVLMDERAKDIRFERDRVIQVDALR
jgi:tetratricopeptide (TPR) repeat protein